MHDNETSINNKCSTTFSLQEVVSYAKEYGFVFPSSEIYEGLQAVYDYGPNGVTLKRNLQQFWWASMTQLHQNIVGIDAAIFMHPKIWKASGHVDGFSDPLIDNKDSKQRYRADTLIENHAQELAYSGKIAESESILSALDEALKANSLDALHDIIIDSDIKCSVSDTTNWTPVRQFNLMFSTQMGAVHGEDSGVYLRPETAQGIFVNFLNTQKTSRLKVPFGIAQIGKAFRNEIVARQFIFRMREFEQMEMQFFVQPSSQNEWFNYWRDLRLKWYRALGIPTCMLQLHDHAQLAHYAQAAVDIEYKFPFGFKEIEGIHSRTDFDLSQHQKFSGKKIDYFDPSTNCHYTPYVIEVSAGCDRLMLMLLCNSLIEESLNVIGEEKKRTLLKIPYALAPTKVAVLPLMKKDGLAEKAQSIWESLKYDFSTTYDESQSIGKRYARQDIVGTPYCITIDHQTLEDNTVTLRDRDTTSQIRLHKEDIISHIYPKISISSLLKSINQGN
jgi:glycyl-tRNA synthetase